MTHNRIIIGPTLKKSHDLISCVQPLIPYFFIHSHLNIFPIKYYTFRHSWDSNIKNSRLFYMNSKYKSSKNDVRFALVLDFTRINFIYFFFLTNMESCFVANHLIFLVLCTWQNTWNGNWRRRLRRPKIIKNNINGKIQINRKKYCVWVFIRKRKKKKIINKIDCFEYLCHFCDYYYYFVTIVVWNVHL